VNRELQVFNCLKGHVLIVGIGNTLRGDDGAGPALITSLKSRVRNSEKHSQLFVMDTGEVPENYLEKIVNLKPDTILFVDAADFNAPPGNTRSINAEDLEQGSFSTHNSSMTLVVDYLNRRLQAKIFLLGIQPKSLRMGEQLSEPVEKALKNIEENIIKCMS